jgi:prepilin-type N-terminal cleavage/methylation domain-containing protein
MRNENGFTLIEVLVASVISAIIASALAGAFIVFLKNADSATSRLSESHDEQITAAYFTTDVQSAETVTVSTGVVNGPTAPICSAANPAPTFLTFSSPASGNPDVTYFTRILNGERQLVRSTASDTSVLVHNLKTCTVGQPDAAFASPTKITNCFAWVSGAGCTGQYVLMSVTVLTTKDPTGLTFTVRGNRRIS